MELSVRKIIKEPPGGEVEAFLLPVVRVVRGTNDGVADAGHLREWVRGVCPCLLSPSRPLSRSFMLAHAAAPFRALPLSPSPSLSLSL